MGTYSAKKIAGKGVDFIRKTLNVGKTKNIATLGGMVENEAYYTIAISGENSRAGTVGTTALRRFTTFEVGHSREFDSEVKLLEDFAEKYKNNADVKATLTITSQRTFCPSCVGVIQQFSKMFPNVQINLINGVK